MISLKIRSNISRKFRHSIVVRFFEGFYMGRSLSYIEALGMGDYNGFI